MAFDNVTLTSEGASDFVVPPSSGISREGPIGPPGIVTGRRVQGVPGGVVGGAGSDTHGPHIVAEADLSHPTSPPPHMDEVLLRYYPRAALEDELEGEVDVRALVGPEGRISQIEVLSDPGHGFAEACSSALRSVRFTPPIDRAGQPVSQRIRYHCGFGVTH